MALIRKKKLMARYGDSPERTVDRWVKQGLLPEPDMYIGRFPLWDEQRLDEHDRAVAARQRQHIAA